MKQKTKKLKTTTSPDAVCLFRDGDKYFTINDDADVLTKVYCVDIQQVLGVRKATFLANELVNLLKTSCYELQHKVNP